MLEQKKSGLKPAEIAKELGITVWKVYDVIRKSHKEEIPPQVNTDDDSLEEDF